MRRKAALALAAIAAVAGSVAPVAATAGTHSTRPAASQTSFGVRHVFVIVLENENYSATYETNPNPYLGKVLKQQGTLLTNYYGTGHQSNNNYLAMVSGQAPNPMTQDDCPDYVDFQPSPAVFASNGQAVGTGCVYPSNVLTLPDQLAADHWTWHGYMEDMGNTVTREPAHCGAPASSAGTGMPDGTQTATATDQYAARHNPFVYFHSLIDSGACHANVVPLYRLSQDLESYDTTPNFSFITPNLCDDGHDAPCKGKDSQGATDGGLVSIDHFLSTWVPKIESSEAFQRDGLLLIVTDEAAFQSDASACCNEQPGPDSPMPGVYGAGGGRTGALAIGHCVPGGRTDSTPYNHYSLLRSMEDIFGIRVGGSDGKGHLGMAGASGVTSFGADLFADCAKKG